MTNILPTGAPPVDTTVSANTYVDPLTGNYVSSSGSTYTLTTNGSTFTIPNNLSNITTAGYVNTWNSPSTYNIAVEDDALVIRDHKGRECMSFKDGVPMIGGKTIHEVVLDIIDMVDGRLAMTDLLVDPDSGKRALGKKIHERSKNKRRKAKKTLHTEE